MQASRLITAVLLCMCCAGCTEYTAQSTNTILDKTEEDAQINQVISSNLSTQPPVTRPETYNSAATLHRAASSIEHLQSESALIFEGGISSQVSEELLRSGRSTSDAIDRLTVDAASSTEAQDLAKHYRSSIARAMGEDALLERLSCGLSICIGIARARSNADHEAWGQRLASDTSSPTYSYAETSENIGAGYENRFIFSTDPAMNSISGN
jgi:hypothetical protein